MCVRTVIDASAFRYVYEPSERTAGHQLRRWIMRGDGVFVYSEDTSYATELNKCGEVRDLLSDFIQRGHAIHITAAQVQTEKNRLPARPIRRSDDPHMLALAAASQATVLFSCDSDLQGDFANCNILPDVGRHKRRSFPLKVNHPQDTTDAGRRRKFLEARRCASP